MKGEIWMVTAQQVRRLFKLNQVEKNFGIAAMKAGMDEKTARKYRGTCKLPSELKQGHTWRTREDPFEDVWDDIKSMLECNPGLEAKTLFEYLQRRCPGEFADGQLRTIQRRIKIWKAVEGKKSAPVRKRKKKQKSNKTKTAKKKREVTLSLDDGASHIANKRKKVKKINVTAERVNDIPLLIKAMVKMGIQEAIDQYIPVQKNQRDLSWGWTAVIWLAYMLSEGDHRKVVVREYVSGMRHTLIELTGLIISENDFTDDRLANLARFLSDNGIWRKVEERISGNTIEAYELPEETVRVDATTVSGYHKTVEGGIFQFGVIVPVK